MPQGSYPPAPFGPPDADSDLPDWLTGSDLNTTDGSDLLLSRALAPDLQDGLLEALGLGPAAPQAAPEPTPKPSAPVTPVPLDPHERDGWTVVRQPVAHDPTGPADAVSFRLVVTNRAPDERNECRCRFPLPAGLKGARANHSPRRTADGLEWSLGTLAPDSTITLLVSLPLTPATAAYQTEPPVALISTRPDRTLTLLVACEHAPTVAAGRPVPVRVRVTNRAASASGRLRIEVFRPGRTAALVRADVDSLPGAGERTVELLLSPAPPGPTPCRVVVTAPGHPPVHTNTEYTTVAPELAVALAAPEVAETDDEITCRVTVTNRGALPAVGARASFAVPEELLFREATGSGTLSPDGDRAEWPAFDLAPGEHWEASVRVAGFAPGRLRLRATASTAGAPDFTAEVPLVCEARRTVGGSPLAELLAGLGSHAPDEYEDELRTGATGARHLLFRAAGSRFAALLSDVREVLRPLPVTPVPGTPTWLVGVANVRGDIVPVVDLAGFLELGTPDASRGLVILSPAGEERLGLLVDDVLGIRPLVSSEGAVPGDESLVRFLSGVTLDPAGIIHRLDAPKLLAATDLAAGATA